MLMIDYKTTLVFVYNADSGLFSSATDFIKKLATPDEYDCNLCMVTHGSLKMKSPWKDYLDTIPNKKLFLHRNEFLKDFPKNNNIDLPVILAQNNDDINILVHAEEINAVKTLEEMKTLLQKAIHKTFN